MHKNLLKKRKRKADLAINASVLFILVGRDLPKFFKFCISLIPIHFSFLPLQALFLCAIFLPFHCFWPLRFPQRGIMPLLTPHLFFDISRDLAIFQFRFEASFIVLVRPKTLRSQLLIFCQAIKVRRS
jgi:hypothetical protein